MNKDLEEVIKKYATSTHKDVSNLLIDKSKDNIISVLIDLLTMYFNDKNSSTLREYILVALNGFIPNEKKIGYNGYLQKTPISGESSFCEAKPKNINTNDEKLKKLNGTGNFTDYTFERLERNKRDNPLMIIGGFVDGRLIYNFNFPFNSPSFIESLETKLLKRFPKRKDIIGEYLRSATFSLNDYKDIRNLDLKVFVSKKQLNQYKNYITRPLFDLISEKAV